MPVQYGDEGVVLDNETGQSVERLEPTGGLQPVVAAEINQAVATAHMYPRNRDKDIINEITGRSTLDADTAKECNYSLRRGAKIISGPSIRFAEIVRASFGNIRVAARFVALDMADLERAAVIVEAVALDLESNNSEIVPVRRSIMTSAEGGRKPRIYNADMTNMTVMAACSIARRNAILAVVPKALWGGPYGRVLRVLEGDADTLDDRRAKLIEAFAGLDVTAQMLFAALGVKDKSDIRVQHMPILVGMMTAIRDGEAIDSVLGRTAVSEGNGHARVDNPLRDDPPAEQTAKTEAKAEVKKDEPKKNEPKKDDVITSGPQPGTAKQAETVSTGIAKAADAATQQVQATAAAGKLKGDGAPDGYGDEEQYMTWMRWRIANDPSGTVLKDSFAKSRADRRELLSADALKIITNEYNAKMVEHMGGGDD